MMSCLRRAGYIKWSSLAMRKGQNFFHLPFCPASKQGLIQAPLFSDLPSGRSSDFFRCVPPPAAPRRPRVMSTGKSRMADEHREALLRDNAAAAEQGMDVRARAEQRAGAGGFSWLTLLVFVFLTFNSGMAIYRSDGDLASVAFVGFSYADLVLLFVCLRWFERTDPDSPTRGKLKVAVWVLTTLLTAVFSYKVAAIMPVAVKALVWAMASATVVGGYYAFFLHTEPKDG